SRSRRRWRGKCGSAERWRSGRSTNASTSICRKTSTTRSAASSSVRSGEFRRSTMKSRPKAEPSASSRWTGVASLGSPSAPRRAPRTGPPTRSRLLEQVYPLKHDRHAAEAPTSKRAFHRIVVGENALEVDVLPGVEVEQQRDLVVGKSTTCPERFGSRLGDEGSRP